MHTLITGGTGLVGSHLIRDLGPELDSILVLTRSPEKARKQLPETVQLITSLNELKQPPELIINLAGHSIADRWTPSNKTSFYTSRIESTQAIIDYIASAKTKPKLFVSASAIGVYSSSAQEQTEHSPTSTHNFLGKLCHDWEATALQARKHGVRTACLRFGHVIGLPGGLIGKMLPAFKMGLGGSLSKGNQYMSWIHTRDIAGIIQHLIQKTSLHGPLNACSPQTVSNRDFSQTLAKILHRPCVLRIPRWALRLFFGEMGDVMLASQNILPARLLESGYKFHYPELQDALKSTLTPSI